MTRGYGLLIVLLLAGLVQGKVVAGDTATVVIAPPADLAAKVCPRPIWNHVALVWDGVVDKRVRPEVGLQTGRQGDPLPVFSQEPLNGVFDSAIKGLLTTCGMQFISSTAEEISHLSIEIQEFSVGVAKKLVTGKADARSELRITLRRGNQLKTIDLSSEIETKKVRKKKIRQVEETLNELFIQTLEQIPEVTDLRDLK